MVGRLGRRSPADGAGAAATSDSHTYVDGGDTDTAQADAIYGAGGYDAVAEPAAPETVQVADVPARIASVTATSPTGTGTVAAGDAVTVTAPFTDPGTNEHHQATIDWGDGTTPTPATVTESDGSGTITATHTYATSGTYTPTLTVTDDGGTPGVFGNGLVELSFPVDVTYVTPTFNLTADAQGTPATAGGPGVTVTLAATGPNAGGVTGCSVDWGDGQTTAVQGPGLPDGSGGFTWMVPPHTYAAPGDHLVSATPTDQVGQHAAAAGATVTVAPAAWPAPPDGLSATATAGEVDLTWSDPTGQAGAFDVLRSDDGGWTFAPVATDVPAVPGGPDAYADATVVAGTAYQYEVDATADGGLATGASTASAVATPLPSPAGLSATAQADGTTRLNWSPDGTAVTGYQITATPAGAGATVTAAVNGPATTATVGGLTAGVDYTFALVALGTLDDGTPAESGPATVATVPLSPPTGLTATAVSVDEVDLAWADANDASSDEFDIYVSTDGGTTFALADSVPGDQTTYAASGLAAGTTYTFEVVQARATPDQSAPSAPAAATTFTDPWHATVSGPSTSGEGATYDLTLATDASASAPTLDHWSVDWGDGSAVETYPAGTTTVSHVFLPGIDTAVVDVAAGTADGTTLVVTPPPVAVDLVPSAPTGLTATAYSPTEVDLAWTDASQDADGYSVLRSTDGGVTFQTVAEVGATAASYADTTLDASAAAPYAAQYQVRATGVSAAVASAAATAAVPANPTYVYQGGMPTLSVAAGPAGSNSAVVTWTYADNDDQGFELEMYDEQSPDNYQLIATPGPVGPSHAASTTVTGLTPGDTYDFRMRADHVGGTASRYTLPAILSPAATPAPTLAVSTYDLGAGDEEVRVGWSGVPTDGSVQIQVTGDGYAGEQWHPIAFNDDGSQSFPATGTSGYAAKGVTSGLEGYVDGYGMVWFGWPGVHTYRLRGGGRRGGRDGLDAAAERRLQGVGPGRRPAGRRAGGDGHDGHGQLPGAAGRVRRVPGLPAAAGPPRVHGRRLVRLRRGVRGRGVRGRAATGEDPDRPAAGNDVRRVRVHVGVPRRRPVRVLPDRASDDHDARRNRLGPPGRPG